MGLLLLVFAIVALVPAVFIYDGIVEGEVKARGGSYNRAEEPGFFWATIGIYAALIVAIFYFATDMWLFG